MSREMTSDILKRLRSIEGHVGGIARMVEADQYCVDILNQIVAVQRALDKVLAGPIPHHRVELHRGKALLHDSTPVRVGPPSQPFVHDTTA